jgi:hypothetical protein
MAIFTTADKIEVDKINDYCEAVFLSSNVFWIGAFYMTTLLTVFP